MADLTSIGTQSHTMPQSQAKNASLGKDANIVATSPQNGYLRDYHLLAFAQKLMIDHDVKSERSGNIHRTRLCHCVRSKIADTISININQSEGDSKASLSGVQTCGSIWTCPVCARRIALQRGREIKYTINQMMKIGYQPIMITNTARHKKETRLVGFKDKFKLAWRYFTQARKWRKLKEMFGIEHTIKAVEVTHGNENGWHYHQHGLLFIHADKLKSLSEEQLEAWIDDVKKHWLHCLDRAGLDGTYERALDVKAHGDIKKDYLAKLGLEDDTTKAEYELTSGKNKGHKGRNIWWVLRKASESVSGMAELYIEYAKAMSGDNWITYSRGLKDLVGLDEMPDEEASEDDTSETFEKLMDVSDQQYYFVRRMRAFPELLEVATASRDAKIVSNWLEQLENEYFATKYDDDTKRMKAQYDEIDKRLSVLRQAYNRKGYELSKKRQSWTVDFVDFMPEIPELLRKWRELRKKLNVRS